MGVPAAVGHAFSHATRDAMQKSDSPENLLVNGLASFVVASLVAGVVWLLVKDSAKNNAKPICEWVFGIVFVLLLYLNPW